MKSSSTVQNVVVGFGGRPAPDTPEAASTMIPGGSTTPGAHERGQRQARRPSGSSPGAATCAAAEDLVAEQLGQPVGEVGQQLGRGVRLAVPLRVERRVLQPEVGGQVDEVADLAEQLGHDRLAGAVGQAEEHEVEPGAARRGRRA